MCGIVGALHFGKGEIDKDLLLNMANTISHRGPDDSGYYYDENVGFGFKRLSIIDLDSGNQPICNEDESLVLICNGEIFNYKEIKEKLVESGHKFRTKSDVEVILHLYEEQGMNFLNELNGQFAFALYDKKKKTVFIARDHVGIAPLFYYQKDSKLYFSSEIKALLEVPDYSPSVNLKGLDQIFTFPGLASPTTMFSEIYSLKPGNYVEVSGSDFCIKEYWDLNYPLETEESNIYTEEVYIKKLDKLIENAVRYRLNADVPVGFYLSGGLDSSLIGSYIRKISPTVKRNSFSIIFDDSLIDERKFQRLMSSRIGSIHHETSFNSNEIISRLKTAVYHSEAPLKESYNTCSLALSQLANNNDIKVVLSGEGADELFAGYVGYRFDEQRNNYDEDLSDMDKIMELEYRNKLWGDKNLYYEMDYYEYEDFRRSMYSDGVNKSFDEFNNVNSDIIDKSKIRGRSKVHKRSYIDMKLRMSEHLLAGHGDRVGLANSVEMRYPFLDINILEFLKTIPSNLKLKNLSEKYILKKCAESYLPSEITQREKFSFVASGSPELLKMNIKWIDDILSYDTIKTQGYFNPIVVERLKKKYLSNGFNINQTFEYDHLMIVLTFGIFLEVFDLPNYK